MRTLSANGATPDQPKDSRCKSNRRVARPADGLYNATEMLPVANTVPDVIERQIILRAPQQRVYAAISEPDLLAKWFPDGVEGELKPGEQPLLDFGEEYGKTRIHIVAADPYQYFAYRWVSGSHNMGFVGDPLAMPNTLVEFHLEEVEGGTKLRLVESGFASLPAEYFESNFKDNSEGWAYMLGRLETYINES